MSQQEEAKSLGLLAILALGVNTIVGSGIFRVPAELAKETGKASPWAYLLGAALLCTVALCFAEVGSRFKRDGGVYAYAYEAFGARWGFTVGYSAWVATVLTLATVATAIPGQLAAFVPAAATPTGAKVIPAAIIVAIGLLNVAGLRIGAAASSGLAVLKVVALLGFVIVGAFSIHNFKGFVVPRFEQATLTRFGATILPTFFVLSGFETSAVPASGTRNPERTVPIAILGSLLGAALLYFLIQAVVVETVPALALSQRPLADAARIFAGPRGGTVIAMVAVVSMVGLCAALVLAGPHFLTALAEDKLLPRWFAQKNGTAPFIAHAVTLAATVAAALLLDFRELVDFTSVVLIVQYVSTCLALLVLRYKVGRAPLSIKGGPVFAVLGVTFLGWVLSQAGSRELTWGAVVMAIGIVISLTTHPDEDESEATS